jgi:N-acetylglucosaminyldiphosphoundecaprenol N-acetyl-beta-D-mannosaminyltransferase
VPLIWISKLLGINGLEKVSGSNLFEHLMKRQTNNPIRAYLFGGDKGIAHAAHSAINLSASGVVSSGFNNPGFGTAEQLCSKQNLDKINKLQPDFLIISLGAQKGQEWLLRSRGQLDAPVKSHLGAVLNFSAGSVRRAPKVLQDLGLEWLWRIKEQPHLFKRYWADGIGLIHFVFTKVLPYANLKRNSLKRLKSATAEQQYKFSYSFEQDGATRMTIKLDGVLNYQNHRYMRQCFEKAAAYNEVILNMKDVKYIDEYGFGLILLLLKYVGDNLKVTLYSDSVGKAFEYEGLAFMLSRG